MNKEERLKWFFDFIATDLYSLSDSEALKICYELSEIVAKDEEGTSRRSPRRSKGKKK